MSAPIDLDAIAELRLVPALAEVNGDALTDLASSTAQRRLHAQGTLVEQGVVSQHLAFLIRGAAKVVRTTAGTGGESVIVLDVMRAPCLVADASVIDGQPALASVITLRSSHVLFVERRALGRLIQAHPLFARAMMARLAQEVRAYVVRIDEIVTGPVDERVKHLLESLALRHGTPLGQGRFIAIPLRRRDIACMVNATTETVSRLLAKFEREGLARSTRDGIWWRTSAKLAASDSKRAADEVAPTPLVAPARDSERPPKSSSVALPRDRRG
jgi:CRP-like cAMP-binding protein